MERDLENLLKRREEVIEELKDLDIEISNKMSEVKTEEWLNFSGNENQDIATYAPYDKGARWKNKILWVMNNGTNVELTAMEIVRIVTEQEKNENVNFDPIVRLNINRLTDKGILKKFKKNKLYNFYYAINKEE